MAEKFPDPIPLPDKVETARNMRRQMMVKCIKIGIILRAIIIAIELAGAALFDSATLLLDALAASVDLLSSFFLIYFIRFADRPPDNNHPFGHGRYEPLAGLYLSLFLLFIGGFMAINQMMDLFETSDKEPFSHYLWVIPAVAVALLEIGYRRIKKVALETKSSALLAEAAHFRVDIATSIIAAIALLLAAFSSNYPHIIDHVGALAIALLMVALGAAAAKSNSEQLVDKRPDEKYFTRVKKAALSIDGVLDIEKVKIQLFGPDAHVNVDVEVDPSLSVFEAHAISQKVRAELQKEWPAVRDVIVHIEPYFPDDH